VNVTKRQRLAACLAAGLTASGPAFAADSVVAFLYHRFGEDRFPTTSIRTDQFEAHLDLLRDRGFNVVPLADLLALLTSGKPLPPMAVAITVDDAYLSVYETAWPRLRAAGWPFTVFVSTDPVDRGFADYMTWDQMREMASAGATFANHGAAHLHMIRRGGGESEEEWERRVRNDITHAQRRLDYELSAMLAVLPNAFAYPYGEYDTAVAGIVQDLGYAAFGQQSGAIGPLSDRRALPRFAMAEAYASVDDFRTKARSLPLPVASVDPWDPVTDRIPQITLTLADSDANLGALACYVGGQGRVEVQWAEAGRRFTVGPGRRLGRGRQRLNCTAPGPGGRYFWYGHQWIVQ